MNKLLLVFLQMLCMTNLQQVCGFLHQLNWPPRYNWNIVESGIKTS
jgi:hypothetical protein